MEEKKLIGIFGNPGSGRTTCAHIIQYLTVAGDGHRWDPCGDWYDNSPWELAYFSTPLTKILSTLIGIPLPTPLTPKVLEVPLPEEFRVWEAELWKTEWKEEFIEKYLFSSEQDMQQWIETDWEPFKDEMDFEIRTRDRLPTTWEAWVYLSKLIREQFNPQALTLMALAERGSAPLIYVDGHSVHEQKALESRGGISILVRRKGASTLQGEPDALAGSTPDYVLNNDSTLEDFKDRVQEVLRQEEII